LLDAQAQLKENFAQKWTVNNKTICLLLSNNVLYAFENKCPHNGASLIGAKCNQDINIVCPLHRYAFSLVDGKAVSNPCGPLQVYKVVVENNGVFVEFEKSKLKLF
jgi:3-phenylpropionate/trans-cinnamate dioxygenase ferredoxin subunit